MLKRDRKKQYGPPIVLDHNPRHIEPCVKCGESRRNDLYGSFCEDCWAESKPHVPMAEGSLASLCKLGSVLATSDRRQRGTGFGSDIEGGRFDLRIQTD
jgi:NMD protein affecting ribosome stability and mRNA decay